MKNNTLLIVILTFLVSTSSLLAQSTISIVTESQLSEIFPLIESKKSEFTTIALKFPTQNKDEISIRYKLDDEDWRALKTDEHVNTLDGYWISELIFVKSQYKSIELELTSGHITGDIFIRQFNPGEEQDVNWDSPTQLRDDCECEKPIMVDRDQWCNGGCGKDYTPFKMDVTHLIIHHSAGPNDSDDWAAIVKSYWDYHVVTRGWDDIGYNWLIDPDGKIYIGRGEDVRGAHFCAKNTGSQGICMIGTFTDVEPTSNAIDALKTLLAWKSCRSDINPKGISFYAASGKDLHNITGHRSDCSTTCPGDRLWDLIPTIRTKVQKHIDENCSENLNIVLTGAYDEETNSIQLEWTPNFNATTNFIIQRSNTEGQFIEIGSTDSQFLKYKDNDIVVGNSYRYKVWVVQNGSVVFSNTITINSPDAYPPRIYPSLVSDQLYIDMNSSVNRKYSYKIFDVKGSLIDRGAFFSGVNRYTQELDLSNYAAGQYVIQIENDESEYNSFKFIKQ